MIKLAVSVNSEIWVALTTDGKRRYRTCRGKEPSIDENGYTNFRLGTLMKIFGPHLHAGETLWENGLIHFTLPTQPSDGLIMDEIRQAARHEVNRGPTKYGPDPDYNPESNVSLPQVIEDAVEQRDRIQAEEESLSGVRLRGGAHHDSF